MVALLLGVQLPDGLDVLDGVEGVVNKLWDENAGREIVVGKGC